jgi:hypothetical protein
MLVGLLRLRIGKSGAFGLARILWSQVRWWFFLAVIFPYLSLCIFVRKGLIWLLLATVAEVPPTVRVAIISRSSFSLMSSHDVGVHVFKFEW